MRARQPRPPSCSRKDLTMLLTKHDYLRRESAELLDIRREVSLHLALSPPPDSANCSTLNPSASQTCDIHALDALIGSDSEHPDYSALPLVTFQRNQLRVLRMLKLGVTIGGAVKKLGLSRSAFNNWMKRTPGFREAANAMREHYREDVADDLEPIHNIAREWLERWITDEDTKENIRIRALTLFLRYADKPHLLPRRLEQMIPHTLSECVPLGPPATESAENFAPVATEDSAPVVAPAASDSEPGTTDSDRRQEQVGETPKRPPVSIANPSGERPANATRKNGYPRRFGSNINRRPDSV